MSESSPKLTRKQVTMVRRAGYGPHAPGRPDAYLVETDGLFNGVPAKLREVELTMRELRGRWPHEMSDPNSKVFVLFRRNKAAARRIEENERLRQAFDCRHPAGNPESIQWLRKAITGCPNAPVGCWAIVDAAKGDYQPCPVCVQAHMTERAST